MSEKDRFNIEIHRAYRITQTVYADSPAEAEKIGDKLCTEIDESLTLSQWGPSLENRHPNTRVKIATYGEPSVDVDFNEEE
jgi:hypothetical protein|tara:strand:- start:334 stop:576 length:243 start_codon:yes stop_codon:yes gene_type:complete